MLFTFLSLLQTRVTQCQWQFGEDASWWSHSVGTSTPQETRLQGTAFRVTQQSRWFLLCSCCVTQHSLDGSSLRPLSSLPPKCLAYLILEGEKFGRKEDPTSSLSHICDAINCVIGGHRASLRTHSRAPAPGESLSPGSLAPEVQADKRYQFAERRDLREKKNGKGGCLKRPFFCSW